MNTYKIVFIKDDYIKYVERYPKLLKVLLIEEKSMYDSKQLELVFCDILDTLNYFKEELFLREDYSYVHGVHNLKNEITYDNISFHFNLYDIEVSEKKNSYIIFEYLKKFSSNFYMFDI